MTLICAICGSDKNVNVVCHHCGKPLCESPQCRFVIANDRLFTPTPPFWQRLENLGRNLLGQKLMPTVITYHCPAHKLEFHRFERVADTIPVAPPPAPDKPTSSTPKQK